MDAAKTGKYIALCRKNLQLSQQDLANDLGISNKTVSKWENGNGMPDIGILPALAERLGITTDSILNGEHINTKVSTSAGRPNEAVEYMLSRRTTLFQIVSFISCISGIIGILLWLFIKQDEGELTALLMGTTFVIVSFAIFLVISQLTNAEYKMYNRLSANKADFSSKQKPFLCAGTFIWSFLPLLTVLYLLLNRWLSLNLLVLFAAITSLLFGSGVTYFKLIRK